MYSGLSCSISLFCGWISFLLVAIMVVREQYNNFSCVSLPRFASTPTGIVMLRHATAQQLRDMFQILKILPSTLFVLFVFHLDLYFHCAGEFVVCVWGGGVRLIFLLHGTKLSLAVCCCLIGIFFFTQLPT